MTAADEREPNETSDPKVSALRLLAGIVLALVVLAVMVFFIGRATGFSDLQDTLREGDWRWLSICAVGQIVVFGGYSGVVRRSLAFENGPVVPPRLALRVVLTSFALSQIVAAGGAAGLAVNYWAFRRLGISRRETVVRLLGLNTVVYLAFSILAWAAALYAIVSGAAPLGATVPWLAILPILWVAAWWFTDARRVQAWATPEGGRIRRALSTGVAAAWWARRAAESREGRPALGWAALYWLGDVASLWGAVHAFGRGPSIAALALVYVIGYLAAAIPIPFIATGGMDATLTFALQMVGVPIEHALVAVVAHRVFAFWIPLMPGIVLGFLLRRTRAELDLVRAEREGFLAVTDG
ncbi:lysylphosphatidylglycerol synthase transmembrane domain-containing protein [Desertimonas flava]|uniref:lysylphosphatidylglycerol synthase transmembrane domain-containing protein n=1 Tax=Desertimonas flava TaxID=2064846 RepID=UPI000E345085|nr:lysylphosphatidylglycerol synthase transmembrane domain-containing protein [Desertimonas flava]